MTYRILHIEDNMDSRRLVRRILEPRDCQIYEAEDGLNGIDLARKIVPDLILMDINIPGMDGYESATRIKSIPELKHIPIIAITANTRQGDREKTLSAGCDGYIAKPIDVDQFADTVFDFILGKREFINTDDELVYLKEYNRRLVSRLEEKIRTLEKINTDLARRKDEIEEEVQRRTQELLLTQEQLIHSAKLAAIGELVAGVSHEINNPITSIRAFTQILRREFTLGRTDKIDRALNSMEQSVNHLNDIVRRFLQFSRKSESQFVPLNLSVVIEEACSIVNHEAVGKSVVINKSITSECADVIGDVNQLVQVLTNLLINAIHAINPLDEGIIEIRVFRHPQRSNRIVLEVEDNGCGIKAEDLPHIFQPFFTTKKKDKGTGLGLSVSKEIIHRHEGTIDVESKLGVGTTFSISLPSA